MSIIITIALFPTLIAASRSVYEASGQRVATKVDGIWTYQIYDIGGKLITEYSQYSPSGGGVKYVLQDWQGSSRAIINNTGTVQARMDYSAFGEEISSGIGWVKNIRLLMGYSFTLVNIWSIVNLKNNAHRFFKAVLIKFVLNEQKSLLVINCRSFGEFCRRLSGCKFA